MNAVQEEPSRKMLAEQDSASKRNLWDEAVTDAQDLIANLEGQVVKLKSSIESFKKLRDEGMPFPVKRRYRERKSK